MRRLVPSRHRALGAGTLLLLAALATIAFARDKKPQPAPLQAPPPLVLSGGRTLTWEGAFSSEDQARSKPGFWGRVLNVIAGPPETRRMMRPYSVAADSRGRVLVTDPGLAGVHLFDFARKKYKFLSRDHARDPLRMPQCVAVDAQDNIYVTDSEAGKIFVWDADGKFRRVLGSLQGGEGFFKRPTGIAVDSVAQRIYVTDTLRHKIFVLDLQGNVVQTVGERGSADGQFNFPTELRLHGDQLLVVDAMNFRVQAFDRSGKFLYALGQQGLQSGTMFRPKGVALDSEGDLYVVDGIFETVQVFDRSGRLLYYFGGSGDGAGEFQLPAGMFIDQHDRIYVVDSYNRRVQVFRFHAAGKPAAGGTP